MEYPTDLDLNGDKDVHLDGANDLATTSGIAQLEQSVGIDAMDEIQDFIGGPITGKTVKKLEQRLRQGFNEDPQLESVRSVSIDEYDRRTGTIRIDVTVVSNNDFTITVTG